MRHYMSSDRSVQVYQAWLTNREWRELFLYYLVKDLSKTGSLAAHEDELRALACSLPQKDALDLYSHLQLSHRPDYEWRGEFLSMFPGLIESTLPAPRIDEAEDRRIAEDERAAAELDRPAPGMADEDIPF